MLGGMGLPARDAELVQIVDAALADVGRRAGPWLVCRLGCTQCCIGVFRINQLDALRLRAGMEALRSSDPELTAEIERRARAWIAEQVGEFPGDKQTGRLGESDAEVERFEEFANDAACPALDPATGRCDVYAWRPMTCRVFRTAGTDGRRRRAWTLRALLCRVRARDEVEACEMEVPHATGIKARRGAWSELVKRWWRLRWCDEGHARW
jgi:Fe-S-cluster containining protein